MRIVGLELAPAGFEEAGDEEDEDEHDEDKKVGEDLDIEGLGVSGAWRVGFMIRAGGGGEVEVGHCVCAKEFVIACAVCGSEW